LNWRLVKNISIKCIHICLASEGMTDFGLLLHELGSSDSQ
jgi:hypothetical protein